MKTMKIKKILVLLLCVGLLVQASYKESALVVYAAETYNASAAINYATANWSTTGELCAGFVSRCLQEGGLASFPRCTTANVCESGNLTSYGFEKNTLAYTGKGSIKSSGTNAGKVAEGDIIVYKCYNGCATYQHVAIVTRISGDIVYITDANGASGKEGTTYVNAGWYRDSGYHGYGQGNLTIECYHYTGNTNKYPVACVDSVTSSGSTVTVSGWAYDPDCPSASLSLHAYVGGPAGSGEGAYTGSANLVSADVNSAYNISGNHRFSYSFTTSRTGSQQVYIYAINIDSSGNGGYDSKPIVEGGTAVTIAGNQAPVGRVDVVEAADGGKVRVVGWAYDPDSGTSVPITIHVYASTGEDQTYIGQGVTNVNRPDGFLGFDFTIPTSITGTQNISVYALDSSGANTNSLLTLTTDNTKSYSTVTVYPLTSIALNKASTTLIEGDSETLSVTYTPANTTDGKTVIWSSNDLSVATVSDGKVTAVNAGTATITAKVGSQTATCSVTVNAADKPLTGISLNKSSITLTEEGTEQLTVTYTPLDTTDSKTVTWTSSNNAVAAVDSDGIVTGVKVGTARITASVENYTASCDITVMTSTTDPVNKPLAAISLNKISMKLIEGDTETLSVSFDPVDTTDDKTITWETADESIATINGGTITAVGVGTTTITAKVGNFTVTCNVTVNAKATPNKPLSSIALNKILVALVEGDTESLSVSFDPVDTTNDKTIDWSTADATVATVDGGTITAVSAGTTIITAKVGDFSATCNVTVHTISKPLTSILLDKTSVTVKEGDIETISVVYNPSDTTDDKMTTWTTGNSAVAIVNGGTITAVGAGATTITAKVGSFTAICQVTVNTDSGSDNDNKEEENGGEEPDDNNKEPENNTNVNDTESNVQTAQPEHIHNYSWKSVTAGTVYQDGVSVLRCNCGSVIEQRTVAAYQTFADELYNVVNQAAEGENITYDAGMNWTFTDRFIKRLNERKDVSLEITFEYERKKYRMIIPAGADYTEFLTDEDSFYGFFYFAQQTESEIEEIVR